MKVFYLLVTMLANSATALVKCESRCVATYRNFTILKIVQQILLNPMDEFAAVEFNKIIASRNCVPNLLYGKQKGSAVAQADRARTSTQSKKDNF
jgi:hypothetical protein